MTTMNVLLKTNESWLHQQVVDFAERYGLNTWDWVALIVTFLSLLIAIISLVIATKTLISQKATQRNTQPIMTLEIQKFLLGQKLLCVLDSYIFLFALQFFLTIKDYKAKTSSHFWQITKIPLSDIDESLFYNDNEKFVVFHHLISVLKSFNSNIDSLREIFNSSDNKKDEKGFELVNIYESIGQIISAYNDTLSTCFNQDEDQIKSFLNDNFLSVFETRYYKIYKEKFIPANLQLVLPYIEDSESDALQRPLYNMFSDSVFQKISGVHDVEKSVFLNMLSKHVDVIIINTPCDGQIIPLQSLKKSNIKLNANPNNSDISYTKASEWFEDIPLSERGLPEAYKCVKRWFFYVSTI
jgi:hypothetical protein